jgi:pimeloyl-ACP methyl ester carboxylesterase
MRRVSSRLDGVPVAFEVSGEGLPTVVFVHGLVGDHSDFDSQLDFFASNHRVVAIDLPGAGESGHARSSWTMEAFGEDVATVVDHLDLSRVVLVGHSLGGNVIVEAALRLGDRVAGLVWLSSFRSLDSFPEEAEIMTWLEPFDTDPLVAVEDLNRRNFGPNANPAQVDAVVTGAKAKDPQRTLGLVTSMFQHDPTVVDALTQIRAPVFAINPDFKPIDQASFQRHGVDLRLIGGVGHFLMMEAPDELNIELQNILNDQLQERT